MLYNQKWILLGIIHYQTLQREIMEKIEKQSNPKVMNLLWGQVDVKIFRF